MHSSLRLHRYALRLPVLYQAVGEGRWHEGITVNISPTSVLIAGELPTSPAGAIAVVIALPSHTGCLTGRGSIARRVASSAERERGAFAIAVRFSLQRQSAALAHAASLHQEC